MAKASHGDGCIQKRGQTRSIHTPLLCILRRMSLLQTWLVADLLLLHYGLLFGSQVMRSSAERGVYVPAGILKPQRTFEQKRTGKRKVVFADELGELDDTAGMQHAETRVKLQEADCLPERNPYGKDVDKQKAQPMGTDSAVVGSATPSEFNINGSTGWSLAKKRAKTLSSSMRGEEKMVVPQGTDDTLDGPAPQVTTRTRRKKPKGGAQGPTEEEENGRLGGGRKGSRNKGESARSRKVPKPGRDHTNTEKKDQEKYRRIASKTARREGQHSPVGRTTVEKIFAVVERAFLMFDMSNLYD